MTPHVSRTLLLAFLALLATSLAECSTGNATLGTAFSIAPPGMTCKAFCKSQGLKDAYFQPYMGNPAKLANATSICASMIGDEYITGYQFRDGAPECEVVSNGITYAEEDYGCLCLGQSQTQGMVRGDSQQCSNACAASSSQLGSAYTAEYGSLVSAVVADSNIASYACLPFDDQGRYSYLMFGHQDDGDFACQASYNDSPVLAAAYSCFCVFGKTLTDAGLVPQKNGSAIQVASISTSG